MRVQLLATALAFLLGLFVGGFAFGQKPPNDAAPQQDSSDRYSKPSADRHVGGEGERTSKATISLSAADITPTQRIVEASASAELTAGPMSEPVQLDVLTARWADLENQLRTLTQRFEGLERRLSGRGADSAAERSALTVIPATTSEDRRQALVAAGVAEAHAQELVWRQSEQDLARLELRDQAIREGWFRSERYFEELQALNDQGSNLREEIGEQAYDNYLFQTGADNRVSVTSIIPGSAADQSGMRPGDIIESYAGESIYDFRDLRSATTEGTRGDQVPVTIRRGDELIETWVARGPVGVTLEPTSLSPNS